MTPATNRQLPDQAILDSFGKQSYLGNSFIASSTLVSLDPGETPLFSLANPAANAHPQNVSLFLNVKRLMCGPVSAAIGLCTFKFYYSPTITGAGTLVTPKNMRLANTAASIMSAHYSPSASSNGTFICAMVVESNVIDSSGIIVLDPGQTLLVTANPAASSTPVGCEFIWWEL